MIINLRPPDAAGPLRIGAPGGDAVEILRQLGEPVVLCRAAGSRPGWGVHHASGLFIGVYFDAQDRVDAVEFGRPYDTDDAVVHDALNVFTTPAADLITQLRRHTTVHEEENGHTFTAPELLLCLWRSTIPEDPDDQDGRFFDAVLTARPGYYDRPDTPT